MSPAGTPNELQMRQALRSRLLTLSVATTGAMSLAATSSGFTRATGSFLDDGFAAGMEVAGAGFSVGNNAARVVTGVDASNLYAEGLAAQASAGSRTLSVGLPLGRAWENEKFDPKQFTGRPYVTEEFLPGPSNVPGLLGGGHTHTIPSYRVLIHIPENMGVEAAALYSNALRLLFKPGTAITLANGEQLWVRADTGPYAGKTIHLTTGWAMTPVTVPLRLYSLNAA